MIARYSRPEMSRVWSEEGKLARWLDVELAALDGWAEIGAVPAADVAAIRRDALGRRRLAAAPDRGDVVGGNGAELGPAVERGQLDVQPARQLALLRPDATHLRAGVAGDH